MKNTYENEKQEKLAQIEHIEQIARSMVLGTGKENGSIDPETVLYLVDEVKRLQYANDRLRSMNRALQPIIKPDETTGTPYYQGYVNGWEDALVNEETGATVMAWAIVNTQRQKVRFNTQKPESINTKDELVLPLYVRPSSLPKKSKA